MMKQLISVLVAALFAAASVSAIAQDKKGEGKSDKAGQMDKKDTKKAAKKAPKKSSAKKGEAKKGEPKKSDDKK